MDQDLKEYLDQHFSSIERRIQETGQQIQALRQETNQRFERLEDRLETEIGRLETGIRGAHVAVEGVRDEMRFIADGVANVNEKLDRHQEDASRKLADIASFNQLSYQDLRRSQKDLEVRVERLERASGF